MEKQTKEILEKKLTFWKHLTEQETQLLTGQLYEEMIPKGGQVHRAQEQCKGLIFVLSGQLRVYVISEEGREVTLYRIREGETCVLSASCLLEAIAFDVFIEAVEETKVAVIPSVALNSVMKENPYVELFLNKSATERFSDVMWTMQQILFMRTDQRVAHFLWDEMVQRKSMEIRLTHDEIARYIGSAREVVTKVVKYFAQEGIVSLGRGKIEIIDKEKLGRLL